MLCGFLYFVIPGQKAPTGPARSGRPDDKLRAVWRKMTRQSVEKRRARFPDRFLNRISAWTTWSSPVVTN
jgi:hypothetical protein